MVRRPPEAPSPTRRPRRGPLRVLGLVGGAGSGKSEAARFLAERGARVIELDRVAREGLDSDPGLRAALARAFGPRMFRSDGALDRTRLRDLVFSDPGALGRLNAIHYPRFRALVAAETERHRREGSGLLVIDGAVILDAGIAPLCDALLLVRAEESTRVRRIMERAGLDEPSALRMARAADPILPRPEAVDAVIDNDGDVESFRAALAAWWGGRATEACA